MLIDGKTTRTAMCKHMRSKEMYYTVASRSQEASHEGAIFWCNKTLGDMGPDGACVDLDGCLNSRVCFEE